MLDFPVVVQDFARTSQEARPGPLLLCGDPGQPASITTQSLTQTKWMRPISKRIGWNGTAGLQARNGHAER